jgi:hypothetical protein
VLAAVAERVRADNLPGLPDLVEILHARESLAGDSGVHWWLHVVFVLDPMTGLPERVDARAEDACIRACEPWIGSVHPIFHVYRPGDVKLKRYHRAPAGMAVPKPPVKAVPETRAAKVVERETAPVEKAPVEKAPAPSTQRSLF